MNGVIRDVALLIMACLVHYCTGLDTHGVTNWQEAQRVVVAREMQSRLATDPDAWLVPRHHGQAYIAKPPVVYWATIGVARVRGATVELWDLRLVVALAGMLGVVATYLVARLLLSSWEVGRLAREPGPHVAGARWAAVLLMTGILYFRSSRIGELDIVMVPSVVGAIGCIALAWRRARRMRAEGTLRSLLGVRAHWGAVIGAAVLASVAALTKGPPSLMVVALGGYGAIVLMAASDDSGISPRRSMWGGVLGALFGLAFAAAGAAHMKGVGDLLGVALFGVMGAMAGVTLARLSEARRLGRLVRDLAHTHPVIVLGLPVLVFWIWWRAVEGRIGPELAITLAKAEADNDLNLFVPGSPVRNLEGVIYGCGAGSVIMLVGAAWWVRYRPRAVAGVMVAAAWVVLSVCMLSIFGKGVVRYLTPVWPGMAIAAGAWLVRRPEAGEGARRGASDVRGWALLGGVVAVLGLTQAVWYGVGREILQHDRSPRAFMEEVLAQPGVEEGVRAGRLAAFEFYTPALDYYAGTYAQPVGNVQMGTAVAGGPSWTIEELATRVRAEGKYIVLARGRSLDPEEGTPEERLRHAGLEVDRIDLESRFEIDNGRTGVHALRVWAGPMGGTKPGTLRHGD